MGMLSDCGVLVVSESDKTLTLEFVSVSVVFRPINLPLAWYPCLNGKFLGGHYSHSSGFYVALHYIRYNSLFLCIFSQEQYCDSFWLTHPKINNMPISFRIVVRFSSDVNLHESFWLVYQKVNMPLSFQKIVNLCFAVNLLDAKYFDST